MANLSGSPKTVLNVQDASILKSTPVAGIITLQGPLPRGVVGQASFVGSPINLTRKHGGSWDDDPFRDYCERLLNYGAKLWLIRAGHYTDIDDPDTVEGTKASIAITDGVGNTMTFQAEEVGPGYNGTTVLVQESDSGDTTKVDILVTLQDSDVTKRVNNVNKVLDAAAQVDLNNKLSAAETGVQLSALVGNMIGTQPVATLAGGVQTLANIVAADYNGSASAGNGWYAANKITDSYRIANLGIEDVAVDAGLQAYCENRQDMRFYVATHLGLTVDGIEDFRDGTGAYSHSPIDSWYGSMVADDLNITDKTDSSRKYDIPSLVDVLGLQARKDINQNPWFSAAGPKRGRLTLANNGIRINLGSGALQADYDRLYNKGINAVIDDPEYGPVYWGNRSLHRDITSLLSRENIADLLVYIIRNLRGPLRAVSFDPNDPLTWKEAYRRVKPVIQVLESGRAIVPGENTNWFWQGDQNADRRSDAVFNTETELDEGNYKARFVFVPIGAVERIGLTITPTDSQSVQFVVEENVVI